MSRSGRSETLICRIPNVTVCTALVPRLRTASCGLPVLSAECEAMLDYLISMMAERTMRNAERSPSESMIMSNTCPKGDHARCLRRSRH